MSYSDRVQIGLQIEKLPSRSLVLTKIIHIDHNRTTRPCTENGNHFHVMTCTRAARSISGRVAQRMIEYR